MSPLSLFARTFSPFPTYIFDKGILFLAFFASFSFNIGIYFVYLHRVSQETQDILLNLSSELLPRKENNEHYLTIVGAALTSAGFTIDC